MAKSIKKSVSKSVKKTAKSAAKKVKSSVSKVTDTDTSTVRATIENLSKERNDAALIWKIIKNGKQSNNEIKSLINSKNFFALLGKVA
jgi:uncharacterized alkaline shock family protein YloU